MPVLCTLPRGHKLGPYPDREIPLLAEPPSPLGSPHLQAGLRWGTESIKVPGKGF